MDILYRSETVAVRRVACPDTSRWVITFDNHSIGAGFDRPGFGEEFLKSHGISAVHILGRSNDWYQYPDILRACRTAHTATRGAARRIAYGSSMGGYAALRLAGPIGADAVLALSPQYTIDPDIVPWENRWAADAARIDWQRQLGGPIRNHCLSVVVFDPIGADRRHVDLIARDIPAILLPIPYAGHPVTTFLAEVKLLRPILFDLIDGSFDASAVAAEIRARRSRSSIYLSALAQRQPAVRTRTAVALARKAGADDPGGVWGMLALARVLDKANDHAGALKLYEQAVKNGNRQVEFLIAYAEALIASGDTTAAVPLAREVVATYPEAAHLRHWLAWVLWQRGDRSSAIAEERLALELHPESTVFKGTLERYQRTSPWPLPISPRALYRRLTRTIASLRRPT